MLSKESKRIRLSAGHPRLGRTWSMSIEEYRRLFEAAVSRLYQQNVSAYLRLHPSADPQVVWGQGARLPAVAEVAEELRLSERSLYRWCGDERAAMGTPSEAVRGVVERLRAGARVAAMAAVAA